MIKRLPGIKVEDDGTIKYQGKPINKFYINGNDFVGGQYGLATNNISHKDVKTVEVMENHQPVKALEGIEFPEEAGINIKLQEDACSRWVGVAQVGAGVEPMMLEGSLFTMRIAPRLQNMVTVKADNVGRNPAAEIADHDFGDMFGSGYDSLLWPEYIAADQIAAPLSERRTRDNLSQLANAVSAWKRHDTSMSLKISYMSDRLDYNSGVVTDYFSNDIPEFIRYTSLRTHAHDMSAQFKAEINRPGYYMKERMTVGGMWSDAESSVKGTYDLNQNVSRRKYAVTNDLRIIKRTRERLFTLSSRNSFERCPDRLAVTGEEKAMQMVATSDFRSTTETRFGRMTRFWKYYMTAGADLSVHHINTSLSGTGRFDNTGVYSAILACLYATPQIDYDRAQWRLSLGIPLKWLHHNLNGSHDYINTSPRFTLRRQLSAKSEITASADYKLTSPAAYLSIEAPFLADYHNILVTGESGGYSGAFTGAVEYRYRNPLTALFFNIRGGYTRSHSSLMSEQNFIGDLVVATYVRRLSNSGMWTFSGGVSKGIGRSRMVAGCEVKGAVSSAESMRDSEVVPFRQFTSGVKPYVKGSITTWLSMSYEAECQLSQLKVSHSMTRFHSLRHNLLLTFIPADIIQFTAGAEHFLTRFPEGNFSGLMLLDASAVWRIATKTRLTLTATNLLDQRHYEYMTYGTLSRSSHTFRIRPRNILASIQFRF